MSLLMQAEIVNVVVLASVLQADLGSHRKIGKHRILRPVLLAAGIVPIFIEKVATHGGGFTVELAGAIAGVVGGLIAISLVDVYRSPSTGKAVSGAGWAYASLWAVVIGARAAFSYGANHWFNLQLGHWLIVENISSAAVTDGLIFMAVVMIMVRTIGLAIRARSLNGTRSVLGISPLDGLPMPVHATVGRSS